MGHRMTITELQKYYDQTGTQHPTAQVMSIIKSTVCCNSYIINFII